MAGSRRLAFYLDAHLPHAAAREAARRGVDVVTATGAGLANASDGEHIPHAVRSAGVTVTRDRRFWRSAIGVEHPGIVILSPKCGPGALVDLLVLLSEAGTREELAGRVHYY